MTRPDNILITGATESIGGSISFCKRFEKESKAISAILRYYFRVLGRYMDAASLIPACKQQDVVIHLAGLIPPAFHDYVTRSKHINVQGTRNVISTLNEHAPNAFLV